MVTGDGLRVPGARANGAAGPQGERHGMARVIEPPTRGFSTWPVS